MQMEQELTQMRTGLQSAYRSQMQTRMQLRMQTRQATKIPPYLRKCLKPQSEDDEENIHAKVSQLMNELNKEDAPYKLNVASRLYGEKTFKFLKDFLGDIEKYYGAELGSVDFKTKAEEARVTINGWVEEKTQGNIKDILTEGMVDDSTRLVLVNAIFFKGLWRYKFKMEFTEDDQFRINKNDTKPVKMMRQRTRLPHRDIPENKIKVLEMPYKNEDLSMIILLPNDIEDDTTGLEKLEKDLTPEKFVDWTQPEMMILDEVDVKLPRFKMEEKYELNVVLKEMGMPDAFDTSRSDFIRMSPVNNLVLSEAVHKAYVAVDEEGTEAAAATAAVVSERSSLILYNFFADHPFLFFIRHNHSKIVLFSGRYCSPE
ncbi:leukocyte elastase inhibitor-like [Halichoeres trimaculatus]|uniref:leukocyte elastase inhibitor-like n=1 Tax=Halichoeres trimaculatus TaxID=147232 RepID=UPI003D9F4E27